MGLAIGWRFCRHVYLMFFVVALIGSQAALFGPAKLGSIPEMLRPNKISSANGLIGLTTVVATVSRHGASATGCRSSGKVEITAAPVNSAGAMVALSDRACRSRRGRMDRKPVHHAAAQPRILRRVFPWDMVSQTVRDLKSLATIARCLRVAFGIMFFWTLAMLAHLNIDQFAFEGSRSIRANAGHRPAGLTDRRRRFGQRARRAMVRRKSRTRYSAARGWRSGHFLVPAVYRRGRAGRPRGRVYTCSYLAAGFFLMMLGRQRGAVRCPARRLHAGSQPARASRFDPGG